MFEISAFKARLKAVFDGYSRHKDYPLVRLALSNLLDQHRALVPSEANWFGKIIKDDFLATLTEAEPQPEKPGQAVMSRDDRIAVYLEVLMSHPDILKRINSHADTLNLTHKFSEAQGIPALDVLQRYPAMKPTLDKYVTAHLTKHAYLLPHLAKQLQGSPEASLITPLNISSYANTIPIRDLGDIVKDWAVLKTMPDLWSSFEQKAKGIEVFGAYAPNVKQKEVVDYMHYMACDYALSYDQASHVMAIDFSKVRGKLDSSWVTYLSDEELYGTYIMLNHALGVLKGERPGALTTNFDWMKAQAAVMKPVLEEDVDALVKLFRQRHFRVPYTPPALMPKT